VKRKLIKQGPGGITISLPINWVRKRQLRPGDEIEVEEKNGSLLIAGHGNQDKSKTIHIAEYHKRLLRTLLASYYRRGYNKIHVQCDKEIPYKELVAIVDTLIGYKVFEYKKNSCIITEEIDHVYETPQYLINKIMQNLDLFYTRIKEGKHEEFPIMRENLFKLRDYALRVVQRENSEQSYELYALIMFIDKISGEYHYISQKKKLPSAFDGTHELVQLFHATFLQKSYSSAQKLYITVHKIMHQKQNDANCERITHYLFGATSRLLAIVCLNQDSN
jgi:phosphate uptake regulator